MNFLSNADSRLIQFDQTFFTRLAALVLALSSRTAPMTTAPVRNVCHGACRPQAERPVYRTDMMNTPMSVPTMVPEPPDMDVPPMMTPVMPFISRPLPVPGVMVV